MPIQAYLMFDGHCEEAIEFYKKALGAEVVMLMRMSDSPEPPPPGQMPPGYENKIMHASVRIGDSEVMMSDGSCAGKLNFQGFSLSLPVQTPAEADKHYNALLEGGQVQMPIGQTFWSPRFGMVQDRFGVSWMVSVPPPM